MSNRTRLCRAALLCCSLAAVAFSPAVTHASNPAAIYVVPSKLDYFPDEAKATSVAIHGAFFYYQTGGSYGAPACGYMYFGCPVGSEAMCRLQWTDLKNAIGMPQCMGFGPQNMVSKATLRTEGTPLANPDTWDLGIGVSPGSFVGGQCAPAQALKCPLSPPADMATTPPADMAVPLADLSVAPNPPAPPTTSSGCSMTGMQGAMGGAAMVFGTALTALLRRRRRR
jgi:hypothetical protein